MNSKRKLTKLGRKKSHRTALKKNLLTSLVLYEHVRTTRSRAEAVVPLFDKMMTVARKDVKHAENELNKILFDKNAVKKVLEVLKERFKKDTNGLVSVYKVGNRPGDNADMVELFVKGYVYKELGRTSKDDKKKDAKSKSDKQGFDAKQDQSSASQVQAAASPVKAKSRSGI